MSIGDNVIIWDLETAPDLKAFAAARRLTDKTDEEIRAEIGDKFPKHFFHSIICIGALVATRAETHWKIDALGAPSVAERTEKELIAAFVDKIAQLKPQLVTFNGNSFDLPVLRYRAMMHRVPAPGLYARPYFNRYTEDALDLCDVLASFSFQEKPNLDELCRVLGMPGKGDGISGKDVPKLFFEGRIREISEYCETDIVNTYLVWLRHEMVRGRLTEAELAASEAHLWEYIGSHAATKPHLMHFIQK